MISLILPYWNRQEAADKALRLLESTYAGLDMEVVIVNDGDINFHLPETSLKTLVVDLPQKSGPMCPATAWNAGVEAASGSYVALSCIEILHEQPVLQGMADELDRLGSLGYVLASAWCPEAGEWHCHSSVSVPTCPKGTGIAFLGMMRKTLFQAVGGFDREYRDGAGYEDRDLIQRLSAFGAKFMICDDLKVIHPKTGATTAWPAGGFERNESLYFSKWPDAVGITVCCVNMGNYLGRGVEYVEKLHDMVRRNASLSFRFLCFDEENIPAEGLEGWHNKIALFHPKAFRPGERVVFFDLDTLILGPIDDLLKYEGDFAVLRDFWRQDGLGPAVMCWEAGKYNWIWEEYEACGKLHFDRGDQEFLESIIENPVILQDQFPDLFCSYKTHCNPYPPNNAAVVCFHGLPRPHECTQGWVQDCWKIGGAARLNLHLSVNTDVSKILANVWTNRESAPWICTTPEHAAEAMIIGTGPSMLDTIELIRDYAMRGGNIFALNNAAKILAEHGIPSHYQVILDARPSNVEFISHARTYLLGSQCDPSLFEAASGNILQWHPVIDGLAEMFPEAPITLIGGGTTVGLSAMALAYAMGYRKLHLFGYDSSFRGKQMHASPQSRNDAERSTFDVTVNEKTFTTNAAMAKQAELFPQLANSLSELGVEIKIYGDGLLPFIAHAISIHHMEPEHACV